AAVLLLLTPLALAAPALAAAPLAAFAFLLGLFAADVVRCRPPAHVRGGSTSGFRAGVALMHLLQPLARTWARVRHAAVARRDLPSRVALPGPVHDVDGGVLVLPADRPRADLVSAIVADLRRARYRVSTPSGWEDHDVRMG